MTFENDARARAILKITDRCERLSIQRYVSKARAITKTRSKEMFLLVIILLTIIALLPCFIIWVAAFKFLPQQYKLGSLKITGICFLLSLATGFALNIELEGGALSGVVAVLVLSFLWSAVLVLINLCLKLVHARKLPNS